MMKFLIPFLLTASLAAQTTTLIGYAPSIRNGGFEDADGSDFASVPYWDSYFPESDHIDPVHATNPRTGDLRGFCGGYMGTSANRIHLSQIIPASTWTIAEGDVFKFTAHIRPGNGFDVGSDSVQLILHVVDGGLSPIPTKSPGRRKA